MSLVYSFTFKCISSWSSSCLYCDFKVKWNDKFILILCYLWLLASSSVLVGPKNIISNQFGNILLLKCQFRPFHIYSIDQELWQPTCVNFSAFCVLVLHLFLYSWLQCLLLSDQLHSWSWLLLCLLSQSLLLDFASYLSFIYSFFLLFLFHSLLLHSIFIISFFSFVSVSHVIGMVVEMGRRKRGWEKGKGLNSLNQLHSLIQRLWWEIPGKGPLRVSKQLWEVVLV